MVNKIIASYRAGIFTASAIEGPAAVLASLALREGTSRQQPRGGNIAGGGIRFRVQIKAHAGKIAPEDVSFEIIDILRRDVDPQGVFTSIPGL